MRYYCFLCNRYHEGKPTKEHFIPSSIGGLPHQWLPVCNQSNSRSNTLFDNHVRDILYMSRFHKTKILSRTGDALLRDGSVCQYKFSYDEERALQNEDAFRYFFDRMSGERIQSNEICAIKFSVGFTPNEEDMFCRGLAKISIGALAFTLRNVGIQHDTIKHIFSQPSLDSIRHFALNLPWLGKGHIHIFSLGRTDVLFELQCSCSNPCISNHVIETIIKKDKQLQIKGMLYSMYGWEIELSNDISLDINNLRLENPIPSLPVPESLHDISSTRDSIVIINPNFVGQAPNIPPTWSN